MLTASPMHLSGSLVVPLPAELDAAWLQQQALVVGAASAILGPLCDGQHSAHDVLHYTTPTIRSLGPLQLETCW